MADEKETSNEKCPVCGNNMTEKNCWKLSSIDLIGVSIVSLFLVAALYFIFQVRLGSLITKGGIVLISVLLFVLWMLFKYFVRFEAKSGCCCKHCESKKGEK